MDEQNLCPYVPHTELGKIATDVEEIKTYLLGGQSSPGIFERIRNIERWMVAVKATLVTAATAGLAWLAQKFQ